MCARYMKTVVVIHEFLAHSSGTLYCEYIWIYLYVRVCVKVGSLLVI